MILPGLLDRVLLDVGVTDYGVMTAEHNNHAAAEMDRDPRRAMQVGDEKRERLMNLMSD